MTLRNRVAMLKLRFGLKGKNRESIRHNEERQQTNERMSFYPLFLKWLEGPVLDGAFLGFEYLWRVHKLDVEIRTWGKKWRMKEVR